MSVLLDPNHDYKRFTQIKELSSYPNPVMNEIHRLSADKLLIHGHFHANPFGSYNLRIQKYPGDIDLAEFYTRCCSKNKVIDEFYKDIKIVVDNIVKTKRHYYSEVKAGLDKRFSLELDKYIFNGVFLPNKALYDKIYGLMKKNLIRIPDQKILLDIMNKTKVDADDYDVMNLIIRKYNVLRWSPHEIFANSKKLPGNKKITFKEACSHDSLVKIDEITFIGSDVYEITNVYMIGYVTHKKGDIHFLREENPMKTLRKDIEKLYYSNMWYSPFKMVKRIFAIGRFEDIKNLPEVQKVMKKLFPFISSNTSLLYQIKSELTAMMLLLELGYLPLASIKNQIFNIQAKIANVIEIPNELIKIYNELFNQMIETTRKSMLMLIMENLSESIIRLINAQTITFLDKVGLNPPPSFYCPDKKTYDRSIIRKPEDNPSDPMDEYIGSSAGGCLTCCKELLNNLEI